MTAPVRGRSAFRAGRWIDRARRAGITVTLDVHQPVLRIELPSLRLHRDEAVACMAIVFAQPAEEAARRVGSLVDTLFRRWPLDDLDIVPVDRP